MKSYNAKFFIKFGVVITLFITMFVCGRASVVSMPIFQLKDYIFLFEVVSLFSTIAVCVGKSLFKDSQKENENDDLGLKRKFASGKG